MSQFRKNIQSKPVPTAGLDKNRVEEALKTISNNPKEQQALLKELEKELKAETPVEAAPLLEFVLKHIKEIIVVLGLFIICVSAWGVWRWQADKALAAKQNEFKQILTVLNPAERLNQLEAFLVQAPDSMKTAVYMEIGTAGSVSDQYAKAAEGYKNALNNEKNTALGVALQFTVADAYMNAGQPKEAIAVMEAFLPSCPQELKSVVIEQIAVYAEEAGDKEKALGMYRQLLTFTDAETDISAAAAYYQARIDELSK